MKEQLFKTIDDRVDELVALTVDLIRFPTINPPGEAYSPCAEYIANPAEEARGFTRSSSAVKEHPETRTAIRARM